MKPQDFGAIGDGVHDDTDALNALFRELGKTHTSLPSGGYLGGGLAELPPGVYRCTSDVVMTPTVPPYKNPSFGASLRGHGARVSVLVFESGGLRAVDYPGGNFSACVHCSDFGVWNAKPENVASGVSYVGAADCTLERMVLHGWTEYVTWKDCDQMGARSLVFEGAGGIGIAFRGETNRVTVERSQFNGPAVNVLHGGGVGQRVVDCNSEGGILARIQDGHTIVHEGWTSEGMTATQTPYLFHFDSEGSEANSFIAANVSIRDNFFGGSPGAPAVLFDDTAVIRDYQWRRNYVAACPAWGVQQRRYASHTAGALDVDAVGIPGGVPLFGMPPQ